jgi:DNA repair protein RecO (recombination protein O)
MSSEQRISLQPAWVLHHRPYRDSSQIAELFTRDHGRIAVVARGVRRRGRRRVALEPFRPLLVSWTGRGELKTFVTAEPRGAALSVGGQRLLSMFYLNELLLRLLRKHDPHPETFDDYEQALASLVGGQPEAATLRCFECRLLQAMGYGLSLLVDVDGQAVDARKTYEYRLESGPVAVPAAHAGALTVAGSSLLDLATESLEDTDSLRDARRLLQAALALYLGDRPLKSRQVLLAMRSRAGQR